ncbi:hypothetical protein Pla52o_10090 [Novipirellula galeiformis]|uniref:Uncharacterized protein n=2 Tax=Novipirellula galeiformis TaxID=2528004 RepID=A0A5C6CTE4_9BACT|nr:hypothetical protein Pla52o_10090 [Novipirellula galeiformis]
MGCQFLARHSPLQTFNMNRTPIENPYLSSAATRDEAGQTNLSGLVRTGQIIAFALLQGVLFITAIFAYLTFVSGGNGEHGAAAGNAAMPENDGDWVFLLIGIVACFAGCFASFVVNRLMKQMAIRQFVASGSEVAVPVAETVTITPEISQLLAASQTQTIIGLAIVEGAAVINVVLMMLDENMLHLVMVAFCLVAMAVQFPTLRKKMDLIEFAARASRDRI